MSVSLLGTPQGGHSLLVLLPGAHMGARDFENAGFFARAARAEPGLDVLAADFALATTPLDAAIATLRDDILLPRRGQYDRLWLGGISLGGLLALGLAADHGALIDGLCLLAPYPGSRLTTNAIAEAGGLAEWQPDEAQLQDPEFRVWAWLKQPPAHLPVFVGYGSDDRFADRIQAVAACFPPASRHTVPGGHDWSAWTPLWQRFLHQAHFPPLR